MNIGEFSSERDAKENLTARQIVQEVLNFGVNDRMILLIIHQLALNLENVEHMKAVARAVAGLQSNVFLMDRTDDGELKDG
jgi:hypothetical protein